MRKCKKPFRLRILSLQRHSLFSLHMKEWDLAYALLDYREKWLPSKKWLQHLLANVHAMRKLNEWIIMVSRSRKEGEAEKEKRCRLKGRWVWQTSISWIVKRSLTAKLYRIFFSSKIIQQSVHFSSTHTNEGLWKVWKEEGSSLSFTTTITLQRKIFGSQRRLYEYTQAYLQWDRWSVQIIDKKLVKRTDKQGSYWIKIFLHFNVLFTFGWNWRNKVPRVQCNSVSKESSILLTSFWVKWIAPHSAGAVHLMFNVGGAA